MRRTLQLHPDSPAPAVRIDVDVSRLDGPSLALHYLVRGDVGALLLPPPGLPARGDALWEHSCFEAFVRPGDGPPYQEFNFAPSRLWAAYRFDSHRQGMTTTEVEPPIIESHATSDSYEMRVLLSLGSLAGSPWLVGLAAVLEDRQGARSFWALRHPPGQPDFHHRDCFALELPAATQK